jgi:hypothetical protein
VDPYDSPSGQSLPPRALAGFAPTRYTVFWPVLVFFVAFGIFTLYQLLNLEDQIDSVTRAIDKMDTKVKRAQYERSKFYALASDILRLAPKDPAAQQISVQLNLQQLGQTDAVPEQSAPISSSANVFPIPATNSAPITNPASGFQ